MAKSTKAVARNIKNRRVTGYGEMPRKRELEVAEQKLYGEPYLHIKDYRELPVDDPLRMEIEKTLSGLRYAK